MKINTICGLLIFLRLFFMFVFFTYFLNTYIHLISIGNIFLRFGCRNKSPSKKCFLRDEKQENSKKKRRKKVGKKEMINNCKTLVDSVIFLFDDL